MTGPKKWSAMTAWVGTLSSGCPHSPLWHPFHRCGGHLFCREGLRIQQSRQSRELFTVTEGPVLSFRSSIGEREVGGGKEQDRARKTFLPCGFPMSCGSKCAASRPPPPCFENLPAPAVDVLTHTHDGQNFHHGRARGGSSHSSHP